MVAMDVFVYELGTQKTPEMNELERDKNALTIWAPNSKN